MQTNTTITGRINVRERQQKIGEARIDYVRAAAKYARRKLDELRELDEYRYCHDSFAVRDALLIAEARFVDIGTFGVEYIPRGGNQRSPAIDYLNAGDAYDLTVLYVNGQFRAGDWGSYVELRIETRCDNAGTV